MTFHRHKKLFSSSELVEKQFCLFFIRRSNIKVINLNVNVAVNINMSKTPKKILSMDDRRNRRVAKGVCRYGISNKHEWPLPSFPHILFSSHTNSLTFYDYPSHLQHGPARSKARLSILINPRGRCSDAKVHLWESLN